MRWDTEEGREFQKRFRFLKIVDPVTFLNEIEAAEQLTPILPLPCGKVTTWAGPDRIAKRSCAVRHSAQWQRIAPHLSTLKRCTAGWLPKPSPIA